MVTAPTRRENTQSRSRLLLTMFSNCRFHLKAVTRLGRDVSGARIAQWYWVQSRLVWLLVRAYPDSATRDTRREEGTADSHVEVSAPLRVFGPSPSAHFNDAHAEVLASYPPVPLELQILGLCQGIPDKICFVARTNSAVHLLLSQHWM